MKFKFPENLSYRKYKPSDLKDMKNIFLNFQEKAGVQYFSNIAKGESESFYRLYLLSECENLPKKYPYAYTVLVNEKPAAFLFFTQNKMSENSIELQFAFKDNNYLINTKAIKIFKDILSEIRKTLNKKKIYACLGKREKQKSYVKIVQRKFGAKIVTEDQFGRLIVEFP